MKRGAIEIDMLGKIIIALVFLVVMILLIYLTKDQSLSIVDRIGNLLRSGR